MAIWNNKSEMRDGEEQRRDDGDEPPELVEPFSESPPHTHTHSTALPRYANMCATYNSLCLSASARTQTHTHTVDFHKILKEVFPVITALFASTTDL